MSFLLCCVGCVCVEEAFKWGGVAWPALARGCRGRDRLSVRRRHRHVAAVVRAFRVLKDVGRKNTSVLFVVAPFLYSQPLTWFRFGKS